MKTRSYFVPFWLLLTDRMPSVAKTEDICLQLHLDAEIDMEVVVWSWKTDSQSTALML